MASIAETIAEHAPGLLGLPGVVLVFEGEDEAGQACIVIGVRRRTADLERSLPHELGGYPVRIRETGEVAPR
jgi:hypothetical protein